ncbi:MAG TPA: hypothetical protein PLO30_07180, partial [Methanothrix soehngenii]|nr:hypothetical protein [Methanothrix soehngenii]
LAQTAYGHEALGEAQVHLKDSRARAKSTALQVKGQDGSEEYGPSLFCKYNFISLRSSARSQKEVEEKRGEEDF